MKVSCECFASAWGQSNFAASHSGQLPNRGSTMDAEFLPCMVRAGVPGMIILVALLAHWNEALNHSKDGFHGACFHEVCVDGAVLLKTRPGQDRDFLEVFAGRGEVTSALRRAPRRQR